MDRVHCAVPFCRRTTGKPYDEWICGKHWPLVPKKLRRLHSLAKRRNKPWPMRDFLWNKCKTSAMAQAF
jgi:hypothetical protein